MFNFYTISIITVLLTNKYIKGFENISINNILQSILKLKNSTIIKLFKMLR